MGKRKKTSRVRHGLQGITLCISTALVLILLGMVVFSVLSARNLSSYVKENLTVTMMLGEDITDPEAGRLCKELGKRPYINHITYISKEQALKEQTAAMGTDPSEFLGMNRGAIRQHRLAEMDFGGAQERQARNRHNLPPRPYGQR